MNPEEYKEYTQIHEGDMDYEGGSRLIAAVMLMTRMCTEEAGQEKANKLFERWAAAFNQSGILSVKERENITETTPQAFYEAMGGWEIELGDKWEKIEESPDRIKFAVTDCVFRGACQRLGMDHSELCEGEVAATMQRIASVINPDLEWVRIKCSPFPEPCLYEIRYRKTGQP